MTKKIRICALVYVDESKSGGLPNNKSTNLRASYFLQAFTLNRSLLTNGLPQLNVYTNRTDIGKDLHRLSAQFPINFCDLNSSDWVPGNVAFSQAHHKIDLLRQVAEELSNEEILLLLDTDVICLKHFDIETIGNVGGAAYNISDQCFQAYGHNTVCSDLNLLTGLTLTNPSWYGGEFLIGNRSFLKKLLQEIDIVTPRYISTCSRLHHQGDEAIISAALNRLNPQSFIDVMPLNIVYRFWTGRTEHIQRGFWYALNSTFLHLPSEKKLLERLAKGHGRIRNTIFPALYIRSILRKALSESKHYIKQKLFFRRPVSIR